ncbi:MAG: diguanylate cyclase [Crocosphaera sp.]|nr:diguanylate cyclase [Crocosphaera sp.]
MNDRPSFNFNCSQDQNKKILEITDSINAGIAYIDKERRYRFVNQFYERRFNHSRQTMIGKYVWEVVGEETYNNVKPLIDRVLLGEPQNVEFYITYETGNTSYVSCYLTPAFDQLKTVIGYYLVVFDITKHKKIEESLEKANQELTRLATVDDLTKIANRRRFDEYLFQEWGRLSRTKQPLSLILFDVDYFKLYNDYYGHPQGDKCLTKVAQIVKNAIHRSSDLVARYGGEEFAVILSNTDQQGAIIVAQRIQQKLKAAAIPHQGSKISSIVSISLGIATMIPTPKKSLYTLINLADQVLYKAKKQGRNRYCFPQVNNQNESKNKINQII